MRNLAAPLCALLFAASSLADECQPWTVDKRDRIFVLTDVLNEPDDTMSLIRLLTHADHFEVEGLVATTSFWLPNQTHPEHIEELIGTYALVRDNLQSHSNRSFPTPEYLTSRVGTGPDVYGMEAIKALETGGNLTDGAQLLIERTDASGDPLYVQIWGGTNALATVLWSVNRTRSADELATFISKLRVYAISDQDDSGEWIRQHFPDMRYVTSRHGYSQYPDSTWIGMSGPGVDPGGPNNEIISWEWIEKNIKIGPLGSLYPEIQWIVEGDSPALLYNLQTGLGNPEYPNWGNWGGRYTSNPLNTSAQFGQASDVVIGQNGLEYTSNKATIWRWRQQYQDEFAARIQWTLAPNGPDSNATHPPVVVVNGSCGSSSLMYNVHVGDVITLDASSSYSPDANANLNITWFHYREPTSYQFSPTVVPEIEITYPEASGRAVTFTIPEPRDGDCVAPENVTQFGQWGERSKCPVHHIVVAARDLSSAHPIERYRRILLNVQPYTRPRQ